MTIEECTQTQLFNSLFKGLAYMTREYGIPKPNEIWSEALSCVRGLKNGERPDVIVYDKYGIDESMKSMTVIAVIFYMVKADSSIGDELNEMLGEMVNMLREYGESWKMLYEKFRESEGKEEDKGRFVEGFTIFEKNDTIAKLSEDDQKLLDSILSIMKRGEWLGNATAENVELWFKTLFGARTGKLDSADYDKCQEFRRFFKSGRGNRVMVSTANVLGYLASFDYLAGSDNDISLAFFKDDGQKQNITHGRNGEGNAKFKDLRHFMDKYRKTIIS